MYLIYHPEGDAEPQRFRYNPRKIMSAEREWIERRTEMNWSEFTKEVVAGSSLCRRALLYTFLKRDHAKVKWEDVDFAWDELRLEYSKAELINLRSSIPDSAPPPVLEKFDEQIEAAFEDPDDEGKAQLPVAD